MKARMLLAHARKLRAQYRDWKQLRGMRRAVDAYRPATRAALTLRRLVVLPSDPWTLVGAKGDEAMMQAVVARLRQQNPALEVAVVTATPQAEAAAGALGFASLPAWLCPMDEGIRLIEAFDPDSMVVVGADVMDGYYSPVTTTRMLLMAEAAARRGVRVSILGFSFNTTPSDKVRPAFDNLSAAIAVNVRDRISLERFQRFSRAPSRLVADSAFMLLPDHAAADVRQVIEWAAQRRRAGEWVLGFNVHPMLFRAATPPQIAALIDSAVTALRRLCARKPVSLLLLSHDYRGTDGDHVCLGPIARALQPDLRSRLMYPTQAFSAAQLKALAGCTDGVVTGRMHLAIASLGMERPVAALTYQDKFQGLFAHFDYPQRFLLSPQAAADPEQLAALMEDFFEQLPALSAKVKQWLPQVTAASALNLDGWLAKRARHAGTDAGLAPLVAQLRGVP